MVQERERTEGRNKMFSSDHSFGLIRWSDFFIWDYKQVAGQSRLGFRGHIVRWSDFLFGTSNK